MKQQNPTFPFLIRECSGVEPRIYGRYGTAKISYACLTLWHDHLFSLFADYGEEKSLALANKNSEQVMEALESLVKEGEK